MPFDLDNWVAGRREVLNRSLGQAMAMQEQLARQIEQINGQLLLLNEMDKARQAIATDVSETNQTVDE